MDGGASIDAVNDYENTALMIAVQKNNAYVIWTVRRIGMRDPKKRHIALIYEGFFDIMWRIIISTQY